MEELDTLYKEKLRSAVHEEGSGGIGLIDISRESKTPLQYSFIPVDDTTSFFSMKVGV